MIVRTIGQALESGIFGSVVVSTEDDEIARIAIDAGADVVERPAWLADNKSTVASVCLHALEELGEPSPQFLCCVYPTAVFVVAEDYRNSWRILNEEPHTNFVLGVSRYNLPPVQALEEQDGFVRYRWPDMAVLKSQRHPRLLAANGTLHWAATAAFRAERTFVGTRSRVYEMPTWRTVDIDTPEDYEHARIMAEHYLQ